MNEKIEGVIVIGKRALHKGLVAEHDQTNAIRTEGFYNVFELELDFFQSSGLNIKGIHRGAKVDTNEDVLSD